MKGYVVLFLLPLPKKNLAEYKKLARRFGRVAVDHGALHYREFIGEDLKPKYAPPFTNVLPLKRGEVAITSVLEFKSRKHRDKTMLAMLHDPRMEKMMKEKPLFDMKKMYWAGFETIVEAKGK
ncbi:MAG: DUF1428 domain-containing protein [bacterium]|nr:DUF1428 domain-containing protein [bacterium]